MRTYTQIHTLLQPPFMIEGSDNPCSRVTSLSVKIKKQIYPSQLFPNKTAVLCDRLYL